MLRFILVLLGIPGGVFSFEFIGVVLGLTLLAMGDTILKECGQAGQTGVVNDVNTENTIY